MCGPVTYRITVMPSHGMMIMINDTAYNITGLYYNTNYIITVYTTNNAGDGEPAIVTVKTKGSYLFIYTLSLKDTYTVATMHNYSNGFIT